MFGQDLLEINENLGLTDSLPNEKEIRIYKGFGITNYTGVFRMFQDTLGKWKAESIEHYCEVLNTAKLKIKRHELKPNDGIDNIWWQILKTNIQDLPNMSSIEWKLKKNPEVVEDMGVKVLSWQKTNILDGESYVVQFRWGNDIKKITYSNPESYLKIYPDVDELIYFNELLNLVKTEFGIWKSN